MSAHVTTFYSFKGGVGRSLLLANVGAALAQRRKVALWDLDLEAPGLHRIPALRAPDVREGFLEWLRDHAGNDVVSEAGRARLRAAVRAAPNQPDLVVLPAHGDGADLADLYHAIPWATLFAERPERGLSLFRVALDVLREGRDHVLIDARTGITDIGGLVAAVLPDLTVLVGGYGHQNLAGLDIVRRGLQPAIDGKLPDTLRSGTLQVLHVISPVPADTPEAAERRRTWRDVFPNVQPVEVPFDGRLLFEERLLVLDDRDCPAARAYRTVAERVDDARRLVVVEESEEAAPPPERATRFEERVRRVLELHGYAVGSDLVATLDVGLERQALHVECKAQARPCGTDALERLRARLPAGVRGMVVARAFTRAALALAVDHPEVRAVTLDELERRLFDAQPYLHRLMTGFESSQLALAWVAQRVRVGDRDEDLLARGLAWARGEGAPVLALQGPPGIGKTAFLHRLGYELAQRASRDPKAVVPVLVAGGGPLTTLLYEQVRRVLPGFRGTPEALAHLVAIGRIVVLVDDADAVELPRPLEAGGSRALVAGTHPVQEGADLGVILPLDDAEIEVFLAQRGGVTRARRAMERLAERPLLAVLATRPGELSAMAEGLLAEETLPIFAEWVKARGSPTLEQRALALWAGADPGDAPPDNPFLDETGAFRHPALLDVFLARGLGRALADGDLAPLARGRLSSSAAAWLAEAPGVHDRGSAALREGYLPGVSENLVRVAAALGRPVKGARLDGAALAGLDLSGIKLPSAHLVGADLHAAILRNADLSASVLADADLRHADLSGANLAGADLRGCRASDVRFTAANLRGARFDGANLQRCDLSRARLHGASFRGADLTGANLDAVQAKNAVWDGAIGLPEGFTP